VTGWDPEGHRFGVVHHGLAYETDVLTDLCPPVEIVFQPGGREGYGRGHDRRGGQPENRLPNEGTILEL
jgi:hypothetical protein